MTDSVDQPAGMTLPILPGRWSNAQVLVYLVLCAGLAKSEDRPPVATAPHGHTICTVAEIAKVAGLSEPTVQRAQRSLQERGAISIVERPGRMNVYIMLTPWTTVYGLY